MYSILKNITPILLIAVAITAVFLVSNLVMAQEVRIEWKITGEDKDQVRYVDVLRKKDSEAYQVVNKDSEGNRQPLSPNYWYYIDSSFSEGGIYNYAIRVEFNNGQTKDLSVPVGSSNSIEINCSGETCSIVNRPCTVNDWNVTSWGACSLECGGGTQTRAVTKKTDVTCQNGYKPADTQPCNTQPCGDPRKGDWGDWIDQTECSVSCGGGTKTQIRYCDNPAPANGGEDCTGVSNQTVVCNTQSCSDRPILKLFEISEDFEKIGKWHWHKDGEFVVLQGSNLYIHYKTEAGDKDLKKVEIWENKFTNKENDHNWKEIWNQTTKYPNLLLEDKARLDADRGYFLTADFGTRYYGIHVVDNATPHPNVTTERDPNPAFVPPIPYGPIKVRVVECNDTKPCPAGETCNIDNMCSGLLTEIIEPCGKVVPIGQPINLSANVSGSYVEPITLVIKKQGATNPDSETGLNNQGNALYTGNATAPNDPEKVGTYVVTLEANDILITTPACTLGVVKPKLLICGNSYPINAGQIQIKASSPKKTDKISVNVAGSSYSKLTYNNNEDVWTVAWPVHPDTAPEEKEVILLINNIIAHRCNITILPPGSPYFTSEPDTYVLTNDDYRYFIETEDDDTALDNLTITALTLPNWLSLISYGNGTAVLEGKAPGVNGNHAVELQVADPDGHITPQPFTITVSDGNTPPVANDINVSIAEYESIDITLTGSDVDGDSLTFHINDNPTHGSLTGTAPNLTYTHTANNIDADSFTYHIYDGKADSNIATVNIEVIENQPPIISGSCPAEARVNTEYNCTLNITDQEGDEITAESALQDTLPLPRWLSFNVNNYTFSGTPADEDVATLLIRVSAHDSHDNYSTLYNFTLAVTAEPPEPADCIITNVHWEKPPGTPGSPYSDNVELNLGAIINESVTLVALGENCDGIENGVFTINRTSPSRLEMTTNGNLEADNLNNIFSLPIVFESRVNSEIPGTYSLEIDINDSIISSNNLIVIDSSIPPPAPEISPCPGTHNIGDNIQIIAEYINGGNALVKFKNQSSASYENVCERMTGQELPLTPIRSDGNHQAACAIKSNAANKNYTLELYVNGNKVHEACSLGVNPAPVPVGNVEYFDINSNQFRPATSADYHNDTPNLILVSDLYSDMQDYKNDTDDIIKNMFFTTVAPFNNTSLKQVDVWRVNNTRQLNPLACYNYNITTSPCFGLDVVRINLENRVREESLLSLVSDYALVGMIGIIGVPTDDPNDSDGLWNTGGWMIADNYYGKGVVFADFHIIHTHVFFHEFGHGFAMLNEDYYDVAVNSRFRSGLNCDNTCTATGSGGYSCPLWRNIGECLLGCHGNTTSYCRNIDEGFMNNRSGATRYGRWVEEEIITNLLNNY